MVEQMSFQSEVAKLGFAAHDFVFGNYEDLLRNRVVLKTAIGIACPEENPEGLNQIWAKYLAAEERYVRVSRDAGVNLNRCS